MRNTSSGCAAQISRFLTARRGPALGEPESARRKLRTVPFTPYDLLEIDEVATWKSLGNEELQKFAPGWTRRWSVHGPDEKYAGLNYQAMLYEEIVAPDTQDTAES